MSQSFEDLLALAQASNRDAITELLSRTGSRVRERLTGRIPAKHRAKLSEDDVMQITYMDAVRLLGRFQTGGEGAFAGWLTTLAENNLNDAIKELGRLKRGGKRIQVDNVVRSDDTYTTLMGQITGTITSPSSAAQREERRSTLDRALAKLPRDYERVLRMYDLEERPIEEVAAALGRSEGAAYMIRARAMERLKELLGG